MLCEQNTKKNTKQNKMSMFRLQLSNKFYGIYVYINLKGFDKKVTLVPLLAKLYIFIGGIYKLDKIFQVVMQKQY